MNDYADEIAARTWDEYMHEIAYVNHLNSEETAVVRAALAQAAREGYALGYAAAQAQNAH